MTGLAGILGDRRGCCPIDCLIGCCIAVTGPRGTTPLFIVCASAGPEKSVMIKGIDSKVLNSFPDPYNGLCSQASLYVSSIHRFSFIIIEK
jgi:hypothetical protein